jgi:ankyrin repeat protein
MPDRDILHKKMRLMEIDVDISNLHFATCYGLDLDEIDISRDSNFMKIPEREDVMKYLFSRGVNPNQRDEDGNTVLHGECDIEVMKTLLAYGANPNLKNNKDEKPLYIVLAPVTIPQMKILLDAGADMDDVNGFSESALTAAIYSEDREVVKLLIEKGADGKKELMKCVETGNFSGFKWLIEAGVDYSDGKAFHKAWDLGERRFVEYFTDIDEAFAEEYQKAMEEDLRNT